MAVVFDPPVNPSFTLPLEDVYSTIVHGSSRGHRGTRARRDRPIREFEMVWVHADQATLDYVRAFIQFHLGGGIAFDWVLPCADLFTPRPATNELTLAQAGGGALADATYDVQYTFENAAGETQASPIKQIVIAAGGGTARIVVTAPPRLPPDATLFGIYAEFAATPATKQGTIANPSGTLNIDAIAAGGALPTVNAMEGTLTVTATDRPRFPLVSAGIFRIELDVTEQLA